MDHKALCTDDAEATRRVREWSIKAVKDGMKFPQCTQHHSIPAVIFSTSGVNVSLKRYPKELSIDPQKYSYSMKDYRSLLRDSYSLKRVDAIKLREEGEDENNKNKKQQPRLLILSRRRTRSFTNTAEIANMARSIGFEAIVMEAGGSMSSFANVVNSCDVILGVHGAGLTNIVFLPENAVLIQVVSHGGFEWLAKYDFELPSKDMGLKYLYYKISVEESTLIQQYPRDHMIMKHPHPLGNVDGKDSSLCIWNNRT
ncbi:hypothetical protein HN51_037884 [Arachis hypogaea]|nr:uncharacterized protein DS421_13g432770 [Arachis hypogaea]